MSIEQRYQESLDYLYSFIDNSISHLDNLRAENFDLTRMRALMVSLGDPQDQYPGLHIAGSKGKGSVSALCASALCSAGYRVGLYTSPHLRDFEERIQVDGESISRDDLATLVEDIKPHVDSIPWLTTFEITTAVAFWYFQRQQVDIAVIEVGLGGRLDATNVITPRVSVVTALSMEHTAILGDTLSQIAFEKAGIIKSGIPVVMSPQKENASQVIANVASERCAQLTCVGSDYLFEAGESTLDGQSFQVFTPSSAGGEWADLYIPLLGAHQLENATTAYAALDILRQNDFRLDETSIQRGFANVDWPARFEILHRSPPIIVDAGHIPDSIQKINATLDELFPGKPVILVFGVSEDKDVEGMFSEILPRVREIICTQSTHPRALDAEELRDIALPFGRPVSAVTDAGSALEMALEAAGSEAVVLVTGSIFVAATARIAWQERLQYKYKSNLVP